MQSAAQAVRSVWKMAVTALGKVTMRPKAEQLPRVVPSVHVSLGHSSEPPPPPDVLRSCPPYFRLIPGI
jgi:hypothetical protein